jgi:hypothetical protein
MDGKLRIRSAETGQKVATVEVDNEIPTNVLITKRWGLIVVKTDQSLFVFSVNGLRVAKIESLCTIRQWITYRTYDGLDFVLYQDSELRVRYFEAAKPEREESVDAQFEVCGMSYNWRYDAFVFVADTGKVIVFPRVKRE